MRTRPVAGRRAHSLGRRDPVRRRLRGRNAAHRDAVHQHLRVGRQRPLDASRLPGRDRAPAGTLPGVSAFQVRIADHDIHTPGDAPDVLVAMNPAALKTNLGDLKRGGIVIVNTDEFDDRNLKKAAYATNPLEDGSLKDYKVHQVPITSSRGARSRTRPRHQDPGPLAQPVRARDVLLALQPADGHHAAVAQGQVRQAAQDRRGQHPRAQGGLELLRHHPHLPRALRGGSRAARGRHLSQHHGQPGPRHGPGGRQPAQRPPALPRRLPDHAGLRRAARALDLQGVRRHHPAGRRRDRGGVLGDRRFVRRRAGRDGFERTRIALKGEAIGLADLGRAAASSSATSSAADRRPDCPPRPSRPICCR